MSEARQRLARQQAELMQALVGRTAPPTDFPADRVATAADALRRKRMRTVQRTWPRLAAALGERFAKLFNDYAATATLPRLGGPLADGLRFAEHLGARVGLPEEALLEVLSVRLHQRSVADGLVPRRGPCVKMLCLPHARRLLVSVRWPGLGVWWLRWPIPRWFTPASATPGI